MKKEIKLQPRETLYMAVSGTACATYYTNFKPEAETLYIEVLTDNMYMLSLLVEKSYIQVFFNEFEVK